LRSIERIPSIAGVLAATCVFLLSPLQAQTFTNVGNLTLARSRHSATLLPNGRVLVVGGIGSGSVPTVNYNANVYDPASGKVVMEITTNVARQMHTATLMRDGRVLFAGGHTGSAVIGHADFFNPATNQFEDVISINTARYGHTATLLANGKLLIAGGYSSSGPTTSAEIYNPATNLFTATGSLNVARHMAAAVLLQDGRVLIAGGYNSSAPDGLASAEVYDPVAGTFTLLGSSMATTRYFHTATVLADGKVLIAGGGLPFSSASNTASLFNPATNTFSATTGNLVGSGIYSHTATLLPTGKVLITGGRAGGCCPTTAAQLYDPATNTFAATGSLNAARQEHTATLLADGSVLVAGGYDNTTTKVSSIEVFRYAAAASASTATGSMAVARVSHTSTVLPSGLVLVAGGGVPAQTISQIFDPSTGAFTATGTMNVARRQHTATLLANGKVLITGGTNESTGPLDSAELYDPATGLFTLTASMSFVRASSTATLLGDGRVLVAAGTDFLIDEIYDPANAQWTMTYGQNAHSYHTATFLTDGRVLVAGNGTVEIFNTAADGISVAGSITSRKRHTATLLPDGRVLFAGGEDNGGNALSTAEIWDPGTGLFTTTGSMSAARARHTATLLATGKVLIAGGYNGTTELTSTEIFDPIKSTFSSGGALTTGRYSHAATLLPTGQVLLSGGNGSGTTAELFDPGLGFAASRRPTVTTMPSRVCQATNIGLGGTGFSGATEAASGGYQSSSGNAPLLRLQSVDGALVRWVLPETWSPTSFTADVDGVPTGFYLASIISNGIPSVAKVVEMTSGATPQLPTYSNVAQTVGEDIMVVPASYPVADGTVTATISIPGYAGGATFSRKYGTIALTNISPAGTYTVTVTISTSCGLSASRSFTLTVNPLPKPTNFMATAISTSSIQLSWDPVGATYYSVYRKSNGGSFNVVASPTGSSMTDTGLAAGTTYVYFVIGVDSSGGVGYPSDRDLATTIFFTDDPLVPQATIVKAVHLSELRTAVNAVRTAAGLGAYPFTDAAASGLTIRTLHISELRSALTEARSTLGVSALGGSTPLAYTAVRATDWTAVRSGVK
jgi:uncharacterized delta-60 repeat protein